MNTRKKFVAPTLTEEASLSSLTLGGPVALSGSVNGVPR